MTIARVKPRSYGSDDLEALQGTTWREYPGFQNEYNGKLQEWRNATADFRGSADQQNPAGKSDNNKSEWNRATLPRIMVE